jgi:hypothetical protein
LRIFAADGIEDREHRSSVKGFYKNNLFDISELK